MGSIVHKIRLGERVANGARRAGVASAWRLGLARPWRGGVATRVVTRVSSSPRWLFLRLAILTTLVLLLADL
jgi:hypothetical protein